MDVNEELNFCENSKKNWGGWGAGVGSGGWLGGQGGCERRIKFFFVKIKKKKFFLGGSEGSDWGGGRVGG